MWGINTIINKLITKKELTEEEKFKILHSKQIDQEVIEYLVSKLMNLEIEVVNLYKGSLFQLMPLGHLEGWCWQTTESVIVFLNDDDYIERGNLHFDNRTPNYFHSWICFKYKNTEYVLDPCLSFICKKKDYDKIFTPEVQGKVSAIAVKKELIKQINTPKVIEETEAHQSFTNFMKIFLGEEKYNEVLEYQKNETKISGPEDINTPFFRNGSGYRTEIEDGIVKKMTVHYYYTDC